MAHVYQTFDKDGRPYARWRYCFTDYSGRRRRETGTRSEKETRAIAMRVQDENDAIRKGWRPKPKTWDESRDFSEEVGHYLAWGVSQGGRRGFGWSDAMARQKRQVLEFWQKRIGVQFIQDLNGCLAKVDAVLIELAKTTSGKTRNHYVGHLKSFCRYLVERGLLESDPLKCWKKFDGTPTNKHRLLTADEIRALLESAPLNRNLLYRVALATGYRQAELRKLTVGSLDPFGPSLKLTAPYTKNRRDARQFIPKDMFDELRRSAIGKAPESPLLDMPRKNAAGENFARDVRKAGIGKKTTDGKATFHSLRVCFIQAVIESGADLKTTMEAARHSSAQMSLEVYAKPNTETIRRVSENAATVLLNPESQNIATKQVAVAGSDCELVSCEGGGNVSSPGPVTLLPKIQNTDKQGIKRGHNSAQLGQAKGFVSGEKTGFNQEKCKNRTHCGQTKTPSGRRKSQKIATFEPKYSHKKSQNTGPKNAIESPLERSGSVGGKSGRSSTDRDSGAAGIGGVVLPVELSKALEIWPSLPGTVKAAFLLALAEGGKK